MGFLLTSIMDVVRTWDFGVRDLAGSGFSNRQKNRFDEGDWCEVTYAYDDDYEGEDETRFASYSEETGRGEHGEWPWRRSDNEVTPNSWRVTYERPWDGNEEAAPLQFGVKYGMAVKLLVSGYIGKDSSEVFDVTFEEPDWVIDEEEAIHWMDAGASKLAQTVIALYAVVNMF